MGVSEILLLFKGNASGALKSMAEVKGGMTEVGQSGNKLSGLGAIATGVATGLLVVGGIVAGVGAISLKMAGDFQQATTQLVTGAGESQSALASVRQGILAMAGEVGQTPIELAKGLFMIESAGYHGADGLKVLKAAAEGAKVGGADMTTVADGLTTALNAYQMPASQATAVTSELIATVASGKMHMQDLTGSLGAVLPTAAALHVPLAQITGAMATMSSQGTDAAKSAQSLRFVMAALVGPTKAGAAELKGLGLGASEAAGFTAATAKGIAALGLNTSAVAAAMAGSGGLPAAMKMITDALVKQFPLYQTNAAQGAAYEAALRGATGGTRGFTAALELSGVHAATWAANVKTISGAAKNAGTDVQGWSLVQKDLNTHIDQFKAGASAAAIEIGTKLMPVAGKLLDWATQMLPKITPVVSALADKLPGAISAIGTILTPVVATLGFLAQHFNVIGPLIAAVAIGWGLWNVGLAITKAIEFAGMAAQFVGGLIAIVSHAGLATTAQWLWNLAMDANPIGLIVIAIVLLIGIVVLVITHWKQFGEILGKVGGIIAGAFGAAVKWIGAELGKLPGQILGVLGSILGALGKWALVLLTWASVAIPGFVGEVVGFLLELPGKVLGLAVGLLLAFGKWELQILAWVAKAIPGVVKSVMDFIGALPGKIVDFAGTLVQAIGAWEWKLINWATSAIPRFVKSVMDEFGKLPGQVIEIGGKIIEGLIKGLLGGIGKIAGAVGQVASSVVGGLKGVLGIHSPSELMAKEVGEPIVGGIGAGIARSTAAVDALKAHTRMLLGVAGGAAAFGAGGSLAGAMGGASLAGGAAGGSAGGNTINVYNPTPEPASTSVSRELRKLAYLGQAT